MEARHLLMLDGSHPHPEDVVSAVRFAETGGELLPQGLHTAFRGGRSDFCHRGGGEMAEVMFLVEGGHVPFTASSFQDLQPHYDPSVLGNGPSPAAFQPHAVIGQGVADISEAWRGVFNCAHEKVDAAMRAGTLAAPAPCRGRPCS